MEFVQEIEEVEVLMLHDSFVVAMWHWSRACSLLTWLKLRFPWLRLVLYQVVGERGMTIRFEMAGLHTPLIDKGFAGVPEACDYVR